MVTAIVVMVFIILMLMINITFLLSTNNNLHKDKEDLFAENLDLVKKLSESRNAYAKWQTISTRDSTLAKWETTDKEEDLSTLRKKLTGEDKGE